MIKQLKERDDEIEKLKQENRLKMLADNNLVMKTKMFQKEPDEIHFLVSDLMVKMTDIRDMILIYGKRHQIEEFYRDSEQSRGLWSTWSGISGPPIDTRLCSWPILSLYL